jgi:hypothetical protein
MAKINIAGLGAFDMPDVPGGSNTPPPMTAEDYKKLQEQNAELQRTLDLRQKDLESGPKLTYNPIQETVGPDGKKTYSLLNELQLKGPEEYLAKERSRMGLEQAGNLDLLNRTSAQQEAQQRANLATRGGLKGANPMLLSRYSMRDALYGQRELMGKSAQQAAELESKGAQMASDVQAKNVALLGGAMKDVENFNLEKYKQQMAAEAAKKQAEATRAAGGSGGSCWVISELSKHVKIPRDQGRLLTKMKIHFSINNLKLSVFYIRKCGTLIEKMNAANFDWVGFKWFNDSLIALLRAGEYEAASALFKSTVLGLVKEFWPECSDRAYLKASKAQEEKVEEMLSINSKYQDKVLDFECLSNLPEASFEGSI